MQLKVSENEKRRARFPHELFMVNLAIFHLLLTPASIALGIGRYALALPLLFSSLIMGYTWMRMRRAEQEESWFVLAHWKLACRRCRLLLYGYAGTAVILLLAWLLTLGIEKEATRQIMLTVFTRIAIMPTLVMVMVNFVLESSAIGQVGKGEAPDRLAPQLPPAR